MKSFLLIGILMLIPMNGLHTSFIGSTSIVTEKPRGEDVVVGPPLNMFLDKSFESALENRMASLTKSSRHSFASQLTKLQFLT